MTSSSLLPRDFYLHPPDVVARKLLGKRLVRRYQAEGGVAGRVERLSGRIVETEAYFGEDDPAAHVFAGKTPRNEVLFGPPGFAYVYFIYGMHFCLNLSCEPEGRAGCVLLRALEPLEGLRTMARLRGLAVKPDARLLASGPGRLCQALGITREAHNGIDATDPKAGLQVEDDGFAPEGIAILRRVGITKAAERPLRFAIAGNAFVSR
ncbi:MAG TPA: DNA-3-methyladenine glycosylase [Acidobacteriaceae bacterium]|jgi:DNA-3-methyladenine glycosylase|nr:DNA-3-methyladenine glycosylase [Acidobacteriaceae bacterium]